MELATGGEGLQKDLGKLAQPQGRERCLKPGDFPPALKLGPNKEDREDPKLHQVTGTTQERLGELEDQLAEDTKDRTRGQPVPRQTMGSKSSCRGRGWQRVEEHMPKPFPAGNVSGDWSQITAQPEKLMQLILKNQL